ncbi:MAG: peptidase S41 [Anaerolineae bacterium]|nr:peptidase S41 [Anaerolineae bacterium]
MKKSTHLLFSLALIAITLNACTAIPLNGVAMLNQTASTATPGNEANPPVMTAAPPVLLTPQPGGPAAIYGTFTYSNDIIEDYYVEQTVALLDMTGFITRDLEWELPVDSQVLGYLDLDTENNVGKYTLSLPVVPAGILNDVDYDNQAEPGVQIFVVGYSPNLTGGPFSEGDDRSLGWATYLASTITDTENNDEVIGGKLVVWSPDDQQSFPSGFGADGRLFTSDDPAAPLPAGYSVVDLDMTPFGISRELSEEMALYEPSDVAVKDFSSLSYLEAYDEMYKFVSQNYAFTDIAGKAPNWIALNNRVRPKVEQAEAEQNDLAYFLALFEFVNAFEDGHVSLNGGDYFWQLYGAQAGGGLGLGVRELDNGKVIVNFVGAGSPADTEGVELGAEITKVRDKPVGQAIAEIQPLFGPYSTDFGYRYDQVLFLLRDQVGADITFSYKNPGGSEKSATLTTIPEGDSITYNYIPYRVRQNVLPVEYELLDSGVGYIRINSNYDDLNLLIRIFERALKTFEENSAPGVIIDMRANFGGAPLGLAGFLHDQEIVMGQLEYFSEKTGKFEPEGIPDKIYPNQEQYRFDKIVLLVDMACFSACEIESYGFSQVPGVVVMGEHPTAGVEAEVARGQIKLPEGFSMQVPTGRYKLPNGSIFLEGVGVQPNVKLPITTESVLSADDPGLQAAIAEILK